MIRRGREDGPLKPEQWSEHKNYLRCQSGHLAYLDANAEITNYVEKTLESCTDFDQLKAELTAFVKDRHDFFTAVARDTKPVI